MDMCIYRCIDLCISIGMCKDTRMTMCIDMCRDMCIYMYTDMFVYKGHRVVLLLLEHWLDILDGL